MRSIGLLVTIYLQRSGLLQPRTSLGKSDVSWRHIMNAGVAPAGGARSRRAAPETERLGGGGGLVGSTAGTLANVLGEFAVCRVDTRSSASQTLTGPFSKPTFAIKYSINQSMRHLVFFILIGKRLTRSTNSISFSLPEPSKLNFRKSFNISVKMMA